MSNKGFTLIEMVLVIALLGILAVAALPKMFSISTTTAQTNAKLAIVSSVQTGASLYAAQQVSLGNAISYPATLDAQALNATSGPTTPFFGNVIQGGITSTGWTKTTVIKCYRHDASGEIYKYDPTAGTFLLDAACAE